eukprot:9823724-Lingulodinium_polyedra.AAC.1
MAARARSACVATCVALQQRVAITIACTSSSARRVVWKCVVGSTVHCRSVAHFNARPVRAPPSGGARVERARCGMRSVAAVQR